MPSRGTRRNKSAPLTSRFAADFSWLKADGKVQKSVSAAVKFELAED